MVSVIIAIIFFLYLILVIFLWIGWSRIDLEEEIHDPQLSLSIIIAVRNEAENIAGLLGDIADQEFAMDRVEVIVVDDHSEDNTPQIIEDFKAKSAINLKLIRLDNTSGKKAAIKTAMVAIESDLILRTDGDCRLGKHWVASMVSYFEDAKIQLVSGPVNLSPTDSSFKRMQSIEFSSLIASGAATIEFGRPTMANAANLAFRVESYSQLASLAGEARSSGDDMFLLHEFSALARDSIVFAKNRQSIVSTAPSTGLVEFYNQRKRWAGKWSTYKNSTTVALAMLIFLINLLTLSLPILVFGGMISWLLAVNLFVARMLFEYWFLKDVQKFFNNKILLSEFVILAIIYPIYVIITAISGTIFGYQWKGRRTR